ncbi:MAG: 50S ribosomal protein L29 [Candidatus Hermodarchaeota archaeon]|nr:50S ribosomal protein L29 [Candidatus Hermodarchaeota archaeon]
MTVTEIREMRPEERKRKLNELRAELAKQRAAMMSGAGIENPSAIRALRRSIARILTIVNEEARLAPADMEEGETS